MVGSFALGFVLIWLQSVAPTAQARQFVAVGFLGSFTTFSTLAFETYHIAEDAMPVMAVLNMAIHGVLGLLLVWGGISLGRSL